jgi:hypothetical protein
MSQYQHHNLLDLLRSARHVGHFVGGVGNGGITYLDLAFDFREDSFGYCSPPADHKAR